MRPRLIRIGCAAALLLAVAGSAVRAAPVNQFRGDDSTSGMPPPTTAVQPQAPQLPPPSLNPGGPSAAAEPHRAARQPSRPPAQASQPPVQPVQAASPAAATGDPSPASQSDRPRLVELVLAVLGGGVLTLLLLGGGVWLLKRNSASHPMGLFWGRIEARALGAREFVEVDQVDPRQTLTLQGVLQRGWSPELVTQVLGRPDFAVLDPQRKRQPLRLYDRARVEKAEQGKKFQSFRAQVAEEHAREESRIRKWLELRYMENEGGDAPGRSDAPSS